MRKLVNIYIEGTWKGPSRQDGVAMWLLECKIKGEPHTKKGFVHVEKGNQIKGNLMALANGLFSLKKDCPVLVFTQCEHVYNTLKNCRYEIWKENGWNNAKGKQVKNKDLWEMVEEKLKDHECTVKRGHHEYKNFMETEAKRELKRWKREREEQNRDEKGSITKEEAAKSIQTAKST